MATALDRIAAGWDEQQKRPIQVLRVLCELAAQEPERLRPDIDAEQWGFLGREILGGMSRFNVPGAAGWAVDQEKVKSRMQAHWPKLEAIWERQQESIEDGLDAAGVELRPVLWSSVSAGGSPNRYGFRFDARRATRAAGSSRIGRLPRVDLEYRLQTISGNRLIQWLSNQGFYLGGRAGKVYVGINLALFLAGVLLLWGVFVAMGHATTTLDLLKIAISWAALLGLGYLVFAWQVRLVANRVTLAPSLLQPLASRYDDYLLELRADEERGRNALYMVRYVADCPICGDEGQDQICIASGRREFHGRLVGRCRRAPNEHLFSFDHVTRQGRYLRD